MYNKYFTMKRSELKEAIKAEIKSVLSEEIQVGDIVTLGGDGDELEVIDSREMFGSDMMAYRVKFPDGNTEEYSANQLRPARMMNEGKRGVVVDPDEIMMHINQYQSGNIDGDDLAQAIEEILVAMMSTPLREDEMTDAEKKKAAEKDAKKEKDFANKQKEVDKLKKELADNKDELVKISKISRDERTKAQQNLLDDMAKKTKELKKLRRVEA